MASPLTWRGEKNGCQVSRSNLNINTNYNNKKICEVIIFKCICIFSQRTPQWEKYLLKIRNEQTLAKPRELIFIVRVRSYCRESSVLPITVPLTTMWYVQYVGRPKKRELCVETKLKSLCRHILRQTNLSWTKISRSRLKPDAIPIIFVHRPVVKKRRAPAPQYTPRPVNTQHITADHSYSVTGDTYIIITNSC